MSEVLFASVAYARYDEKLTLPAKFERLLEKSGLSKKICGKKVAIKMHVGRVYYDSSYFYNQACRLYS